MTVSETVSDAHAASLHVHRAILSAHLRARLQYRAAAIAGFGTQLFWGLIRVMIFTAFYRSTTAPQPLSLPDLVTYLWLTQAMFALSMWGADGDIRAMIGSGTVAYEMLRPLDLYALWYSRALAARLAPTLLRAVPMFVVAGLLLGLGLPPSPLCGLLWLAATCGAFLQAAAFSVLLTVSLLYTVSGEGITRLAPTVMVALSGILIPLPFLPAWIQPLVNFLPFRGMMDTPFRLYLGQMPPAQIGAALAHQIGWTVAIVLLGRWLLARATRRLVVQGG